MMMMAPSGPAMPSLLSHPPKLHKSQLHASLQHSKKMEMELDSETSDSDDDAMIVEPITTSPVPILSSPTNLNLQRNKNNKANNTNSNGGSSGSGASQLVIRNSGGNRLHSSSPPSTGSASSGSSGGNASSTASGAMGAAAAAAGGHFSHRLSPPTSNTRSTTVLGTGAGAPKLMMGWRTGAEIDWSVDRLDSPFSPDTPTTNTLPLDNKHLISNTTSFTNSSILKDHIPSSAPQNAAPVSAANAGMSNIRALINSSSNAQTTTTMSRNSPPVTSAAAQVSTQSPMSGNAKALPMASSVPSRRSSSASSSTSFLSYGTSNGSVVLGRGGSIGGGSGNGRPTSVSVSPQGSMLGLSPPMSNLGLSPALSSVGLVSPRAQAQQQRGVSSQMASPLNSASTVRRMDVSPLTITFPLNNNGSNRINTAMTKTATASPPLPAPRPMPFQPPIHALLAQQAQQQEKEKERERMEREKRREQHERQQRIVAAAMKLVQQAQAQQQQQMKTIALSPAPAPHNANAQSIQPNNRPSPAQPVSSNVQHHHHHHAQQQHQQHRVIQLTPASASTMANNVATNANVKMEGASRFVQQHPRVSGVSSGVMEQYHHRQQPQERSMVPQQSPRPPPSQIQLQVIRPMHAVSQTQQQMIAQAQAKAKAQADARAEAHRRLLSQQYQQQQQQQGQLVRHSQQYAQAHGGHHHHPHHLRQGGGGSPSAHHRSSSSMSMSSSSSSSSMMMMGGMPTMPVPLTLSEMIQHQHIYQCPHCPQVYRKIGHLNRHALTHAGKRFHCEFDGCNRTFSRLDNAKTHMRNMHNNPDKIYVMGMEIGIGRGSSVGGGGGGGGDSSSTSDEKEVRDEEDEDEEQEQEEQTQEGEDEERMVEDEVQKEEQAQEREDEPKLEG